MAETTIKAETEKTKMDMGDSRMKISVATFNIMLCLGLIGMPLAMTAKASEEFSRPTDIGLSFDGSQDSTGQIFNTGIEGVAKEMPSVSDKMNSQVFQAQSPERQISMPKSSNQPSAQVAQAEPEEAPVGVEKGAPKGEGISGEILERKGGYIHPFVSLTETYSDNVFRTNTDTVSGYSTILSPGLWAAFPRSRQRLLNISPLNVSPGGLLLSRGKSEVARRYQTYFLYGADIEFNSAASAQDAVSHRFEGLLQYKMNVGLSIELADQLLFSHDTWETGVSTTELSDFTSNLISLIISYDLTDRYRIRADVGNYDLNYDDQGNEFRDRQDNSLAGYLYYRYSPKTSFFVEYEIVDVQYDVDPTMDSTEHHIYGGVEWDMTAKSRGRVKAGYGVKNFDDPTIDNNQGLYLELMLGHDFTAKTGMEIIATHKTNETSMASADYTVTDSIHCSYLQKMTSRLTGSLTFSYINDDYIGDMTVGDETKERVDHLYRLSPALRYMFKEWLGVGVGYIYSNRDSNFSDFDFVDNSVYIKATLTL